MSVEEKIIMAIVLLVFVVSVTGFASFITLFTIGPSYIPLIIMLMVAIYCGFLMYLFGLLKYKKWFWGIVSLGIVFCLIQPIYQFFDSKVATVDAEVDIYQYMPFTNSNLIVTLPEKAPLKLSEPLPKIDGATALYPLYAAISQAIYPEKSYDPYNSEVMVNTTPDAYTNLFNGDVDLIFVLTPSEQQLNRAKVLGVELEYIPIGKEAFVFFVNHKNEVENLTLQQVKDIYSGKITNWSELGGKNEDIRAFQRPQDSGSQTALQKLMEGTPIMEAPTDDIVSLMGGIINEVAQYKNYKSAIGYTFRYFSNEMVKNEEIKLLEINGIAPTKETIRSNEYPITHDFYIVTTADPDEKVQQIIDWVLSEQGQQLIEQSGYIPITSNE